MKKSVLPIAVALAAISALTACGGSKDSFPADNPVVEGDYLEAVFTVYTSAMPENKEKTAANTRHLNSLNIGGKSINLPSADATPLPDNPDFVPLGAGVVSAAQMSYSRYGIVIDKDFAVPVVSLFARGYPGPVAEIPLQAQYQGHAVLAYDSNPTNPGTEIHYLLGQSAFTLHNKHLTGIITVPAAAAAGLPTTIKLSADIQGNKFSGEEAGTTVRGGFYGPHGAEIAGTYQNTGYAGSFGGKKQTTRP